MNRIVLFFIFFFPIQALKAQEFRWDCSSSFSLGYARAINVFNMTKQRYQVPQNTVSVNFKFVGIFVGVDVLTQGNKVMGETERSTTIGKVGYGYRYDNELNEWALSFTPYIGKAWYNDDGNKLHSFVFGSRISYFFKALEVGLDLSNRSFGITVGVVYWNASKDY